MAIFFHIELEWELPEQYLEMEQKQQISEKNAGFKKVIDILNANFESSCSRTPQYLAAHATFKREFTKILKPICSEILIHKPNHFDISGFFKLNAGRIYYFSIGDLRMDKVF